MCSKKGYLWVFPEESQFRITSGQQVMASYAEDGHSGEHFFCPSCGTGIMAKNHMIQEGALNIAVNARSLFGVNPFALEVRVLDSLENSETISAPFHGEPPKASGDNLKLYTGGCYCGAVTIAVTLNPLTEVEIKEDNCSICQRVSIHPESGGCYQG
ncbi:hypothetical protein N7451_009743 [Penicillium sp. IBT 35674x]|nr:hypothetical protein N7451_009743 [Penicillium sp. IBT 35674x]